MSLNETITDEKLQFLNSNKSKFVLFGKSTDTCIVKSIDFL